MVEHGFKSKINIKLRHHWASSPRCLASKSNHTRYTSSTMCIGNERMNANTISLFIGSAVFLRVRVLTFGRSLSDAK